MSRIRILLLCAALGVPLLGFQLLARAAAPAVISASYEVRLNGLPIAITQEHFESGRHTYRIVSESNAVGLLALVRKNSATVVSNGRLLSSGLQPELFEGKSDNDNSGQVSARFDWARKQLTLNHGGKTETMPLPFGTQDRISLLYQFMFVAFDGLKHLDVVMTNGRKLDQYRYLITRNVVIDTPLGRKKTLHLVKQRRSDETAAEVWLAPQYHFLPVKVLIVEKDGARYEQVITKLVLGSQPLKP